jgi:acetolactate synthase-1/2/3 large subunit
MGEITGGELILKYLAQEKVSHIFGVPDFAYNPILGKLDKYGIRFVTPRHEAAAAHMADAFYRASGQVAATLSGAGPGTANLLSAFVTAYAEGIPIIGITAQRRQKVCYPEKGGTFQYTDQVGLFSHVTKWNAYVPDVERIPEYMQKAFREALSGRPGPVQLDVPDDVIYATVEEEDFRLATPERYRMNKRLPGDPELVSRAAKLLAEAKLPLLHLGGGIRHSWAHREALALSDFLGAPMSISPAAKGFIPSDHPLSFNVLSEANIEVRKTADVVLVVGSQMGDLEFYCQPPDWGDFAAQKFIQVDIDPSILGRGRDVDIAILGDAKEVLADLLTELKAVTKKREMGKEVERLKEINRKWREEMIAAAEKAPSSPVHPGKLALEVRDFFPRDALMAMDGGNTSLYSMIYHDCYEPGAFFWTSKFGHLGTGIPYIMGAKLARPDKLAYVITGDSSAGFNRL